MTIKDNQVVGIHPSSVLDHRPDFVLYHDFVLTKNNYIRTCLGKFIYLYYYYNIPIKEHIFVEIKGEWLFEIAKDYFNPRNIKHIETRKELDRLEKEVIMAK